MKRIGIISDTHGLLSRPALTALADSDLIFHAGDIGDPSILNRLARLAPVVAVRGNTDGGPWAQRLPVIQMSEVDGFLFCILHDIQQLDLDPTVTGVHAVIGGHTHRPQIKREAGVLWFNPGSAGQARHGGPLSLGRIRVTAVGLEAEIIILPD